MRDATTDDEAIGGAEVPREKVDKHTGGSPRWRVIVELLVVAAICWLAANALRDATFQATTTQTLAQMQDELKAIVKIVPARYGDPK